MNSRFLAMGRDLGRDVRDRDVILNPITYAQNIDYHICYKVGT